MQHEKHFTPEEAERALPLVERVVRDILDLGKKLRSLKNHPDSLDENLAKQRELVREMEYLMNELHQIGCFYKDWNFEIGLVDFPAIIDGEEVFLCWKSDEPELTYYHGINEGFRGRKRIPVTMRLGA